MSIMIHECHAKHVTIAENEEWVPEKEMNPDVGEAIWHKSA